MRMEYERRSGGGGGGMGLGGCFSCCFGGGEAEAEAEGTAAEKAARALRTSSRWVRERAGELPELVARVRRPRRRHQQHAAAGAGEFGYDPISYALNFEEDGAAGEDAGEEEQPFKYRGFTSRLPASPPPGAAAAAAVDLNRSSS